MHPESDYINEAKRQVGAEGASFVNVIFFDTDDMTSYSGSILPFRTEKTIGFETAFKFQDAIRQVVRMQESSGRLFQGRRIGIIVADHNLGNAQMITDAVTGVFVNAEADIKFALATNMSMWLNTRDSSTGTVLKS